MKVQLSGERLLDRINKLMDPADRGRRVHRR